MPAKLLALLVLLSFTRVALAVPGTVSIDATDDDAKITLTVLKQAIGVDGSAPSDAKSWCQVRLVDAGSEVKFKANDKIKVWVYEDDLSGDDLLWSTEVTVTGEEVAAGKFDRTFDCSAGWGTDVYGMYDVYAQAQIDKDDCGWTCNTDEPETAAVDVEEVVDDGAEADDGSDKAPLLPLGATNDRIGRDADWLKFQLAGLSDVRVEALHVPTVGRLDVQIYAAGDVLQGSGAEGDAATTLDAAQLPAGDYWVRVSPKQADDYNFYDLRLSVTPVVLDCDQGMEQNEDCGNCGKRTRVCLAGGTWGGWSDCANEGPCAAGASEAASCGNCGTLTRSCGPNCQWTETGCLDEGQCAAGAIQNEACPNDGQKSRKCLPDCSWAPWGACAGQDCQGEQSEACYTGPAETRGKGACHDGVHTCVNGFWTTCDGEKLPSAESCNDAKDNDCDGQTDATDDDCLSTIGEACAADGDCGDDLTCLMAPFKPVFDGGYCSILGCLYADDCPPDANCTKAYGMRACLKGCDAAADCRAGYLCESVDGKKVCLPKCKEDDHCKGDVFNPECDETTGLCVPDAPDEPDQGGEDTSTPDTTGGNDTATGDDTPGADTAWILDANAGDDTASSGGGGGCTVSAVPTAAPFLVLLALGALLALARRRV